MHSSYSSQIKTVDTESALENQARGNFHAVCHSITLDTVPLKIMRINLQNIFNFHVDGV
jgi:hypothetical protein